MRADPDTPLRIQITETEETLMRGLDRAQLALRRNPRLVRMVLGALAAEGRAYAGTEEGAALKQQLLASQGVERLALVWTALGLPHEAPPPPALLPSRWIGLVGVLVDHPAVWTWLDGLTHRRAREQP